MADDAVVFLFDPREEARHIDRRDDRDVEGVAEPHEPGSLLRSRDIKCAGENGGLVGDHANRVPVESAQPHHDVLGPKLVNLQEFFVVKNRLDHLGDVVGLVRRVGDDDVERVVQTVGSISRGVVGRHLHVVAWQEGDEIPHRLESILSGRIDEVGDTRLGGMSRGSAQLLHRHVLTGHRLDDIGARDEHVRGLVDLEDEIGQRGGVDGTAGTRSHDHRDLGDDARRSNVALKDSAVAVK